MSHIEIITIGDELIEGRLVDTNAGLMSERLTAEGFDVVSHLSVGDNIRMISEALQSAAVRSDAVLVSGGLGPTSDDLTAVAAATAFGLPMARSPEALEHVRGFFRDRGRRMTENNEKQADLPGGCTLLPNPGGTALGFQLQDGDCRLYFMPGVPRELSHIFTQSVLPDLRSFLFGAAPVVATLKVFGKGESEVAHLLDGLEVDPASQVSLTVQYRATFPEIHVRLLVSGQEEPARAELTRLCDEARTRLGKYLFAVGGPIDETTFPDSVISRVRRAGVTFAVADGCTGGELSRLVSQTEDGAEVFAGAVVTPTAKALFTMLHGAENEVDFQRTAEVAADSVCERFGTSMGISVIGSPRRDDGSTSGALVVATSAAGRASSREFSFPVEPDRFRRLAAYVALAMLAQSLTR